ncbi:uncharacterized protein IL334_001376 [Kwoniella shivajii]|uniref:Zn(2)-C6 fungal-type domain-containing protein n=1 Tax=Kwoniella shivajii TaxID=564305 RepID=A0ABZ1CTC8_9TREE|nr:hypothetical protein IL334_001376 [Kwoniella shivajii]
MSIPITSGGEPQLRPLSPQPTSAKISCLACRLAKRKCHTSDAHTTCRRCVNHGIVCQYNKHQRGRKKKASTQDEPDQEFEASNTQEAVTSDPQFFSESSSAAVARSTAESNIALQTSQQSNLDFPVQENLSIHFSHVIPVDGDSSPVSYFQHLNAIGAILDPCLHTPPYCRRQSTLLFTSVLTVTAKVIRPKLYTRCLMLANKLVGQAVEFGLCSVEVVQALNLLHHWKKSEDSTSWRRVGYAIRMAQELKLDVAGPRPLPEEEISAREILNRERAWLNLIVADYHLASLNRDPGNMRTLDWLDLEWRRWRGKWLADGDRHRFTQPQLSTFRLCDAYFRFHITEYRLLVIARFGESGHNLNLQEHSSMSSAFSDCIEAALGVAMVVQHDLAPYRYLPYCFYLTWVALAVTSIWLVKNIAPMSQSDRARVIRTLSEVQFFTEEASCSSDDMAAYTHRLLKHLLNGISPEWQLATFLADPLSHDGSIDPMPAVMTLETTSSTSVSENPNWELSTAQEIIQGYLWNQPHTTQPHEYDIPLVNVSTAHQAEPPSANMAANGQFNDLLFPADDDDFW